MHRSFELGNLAGAVTQNAPSRRARQGWAALRYLGPRWLGFRLRRTIALKTGIAQLRTPIVTFAESVAAGAPRLFTLRPQFASTSADQARLLDEANAILQGRFLFFGVHSLQLGVPPNWHRNPLSGQQAPPGEHWSKLGEFAHGDVKAIWELSRAGWAFTLARAYALSSNERYAEAFWALFDDWCAHNPANAGINWRCGQEASLRLIALSFAVSVLQDSKSTTEQRLQRFACFVLATARRVEAELGYALSQSNNHGASECVGLLTAACLLRAEPDAERWRRQGLQHLCEQLAALCYADGGFAQHSLGYQRLMVQVLSWACAVLEQSGQRAPTWLFDHLTRLAALLELIVDPKTGQGPFFGPNDGSNVLLLEEADALDLRPTLTLARQALEGRVSGPTLAGRPLPDPAGLARLSVKSGSAWHAPDAGLFGWKDNTLSLLQRCPVRFRHRPSQADMLHTALWCDGWPVTIDPGTYSYNAKPPFVDAFTSARVHSVPLVVGREPMQQVSRFLLVPWPSGRAQFDTQAQRFTASHDAYEKHGVFVSRAVTHPSPERFEIRDRFYARQPTTVAVHWLLRDGDWQQSSASTLWLEHSGFRVTLDFHADHEPSEVTRVRADADSDRGWQAPHYLELVPALSLMIRFEIAGVFEVRTGFECARSTSLGARG